MDLAAFERDLREGSIAPAFRRFVAEMDKQSKDALVSEPVMKAELLVGIYAISCF